MTAQENTQEQAGKIDEPLAMQDVTDRLEHLTVALMFYVDAEHIPPRALSRWIAGRSAYVETLDHAKHMHRPPRRLAYLWLLDALLASPDALVAAVQAARDKLVATDEALQPFAE